MLLRLFLSLIKPTNEQLRNVKGDSRLSRYTLKLYRWLLKQLQKSYLCFAISDTIILENSRIKIVHEFRDIEFENELERNGIDIRPHMLATTLPINARKNKRKIWYGYFRFKDLLSIYINDKELFVKHDSSFSTSGTTLATVKKSSSSDIIDRCVIELFSEQEHKQNTARIESDITQSAKEVSKENPKTKFAVIEKQGFEIDTTF